MLPKNGYDMQSDSSSSHPLKHGLPPDSADVAKQREAPDPFIAINLSRLMEQHGLSQSALAARAKVGQSTISRLLVGDDSPTSRTLAKLAAALSVQVDEFFRPHLTIAEPPARYPSTHNGGFEQAGPLPAPHRVPVVGMAKMDDNGMYEELLLGSGQKNQHVKVHTRDPKAYALRVRGDALQPAVRDGWIIVAEPASQPEAGEYVLITTRDGRKMMMELLYQRGDSVAVLAITGQLRLTLSQEEIASMHHVTAILPPSKIR